MLISRLGTLFVFLGIGLFIFSIARLMQGSAIDPQAIVPGTFSVETKEPGRYYLWDNYRTTFEGKSWHYDADCPQDASVKILDASGERLVFVADNSNSWSIGNHSKQSIGYVDVEQATTLTAEVNEIGRERIVTVSKRTVKEELWKRLGGLGIGLLLGAVGVVIKVGGVVLRRQDS